MDTSTIAAHDYSTGLAGREQRVPELCLAASRTRPASPME